jgi:hypothetical protein
MARPDPGEPGSSLVLPLSIIAVAIVAFFVLTSAREAYDLDRSAIGFDGLATWLSKNGVEARTFAGGDRLTADRVGLRIYPLFDIDLGHLSPNGPSTNAPGGPSGLPQVAPDVVQTKRSAAPTLIVLPKWRGEVIELGLVHPRLLLPAEATGQLLAAIAPEAGTMLPRGDRFTTITSEGGAVKLYAAQLAKAGRCRPLIGTSEAMLLGICTGRGASSYWLLTDPDLIDNHGLTQGDNARTAVAILARVAGARPVVIDRTLTAVWDEAPRHERERSWGDLLRFLAPPFTFAWAALALLIGLVAWRASIRNGPVEASIGDTWRAAQTVSIEARARLLRLSGHDATLVRVYTNDRLQSLAEGLFGRHRVVGGDPFARVARLLESTPALAAGFRQAFQNDPAPIAASESDLLRRVEDLTRIRERILDEFGRAARPRGAHPD